MEHNESRPPLVMPCPFCLPDREVIAENEMAFAVFDDFPVSDGHALVISRRHAPTIFDLNDQEYAVCFDLVLEVQQLLQMRFSTSAFNVGINCGEVAGQTVAHPHIHVIPHCPGDVEDPRGGVRHVIPGRDSTSVRPVHECGRSDHGPGLERELLQVRPTPLARSVQPRTWL